jgi:ATP-dependent DNA ligase
MIKTLAALEAAATTNSRLEKIAVLRTADQGFLREIMFRTYNPFMMYRVTISDKIEDSTERIPATASEEARGGQWKKFFNLLDALMIGGVPKDDVEEFLSFQTMHDAKWMTRVLNRDLKAGISIGAMEAIYGKRCIPTFDVQLAQPFDKVKNYPKRAYVEPKYDGLRGIAFKRKGCQWEFVSRSGKPLWNTELISLELDQLDIEDYVLDGEFFGADWNDTQSVLKTQVKPIKGAAEFAVKMGKLKFWVFDGMLLTDWEAGVCEMVQSKRVGILDDILGAPGLKYLAQPPRHYVESLEGALSYAKAWLEQGLEGGVLKDMDGLYTWKRSEAWLKIKFTKEVDIEVTGVRMGGGRLEGLIGAVEGIDPDGNCFAIGTGFSDADRIHLTTLHKEGRLVGKIVECRPQDVGSGWKGTGRIAVYERLREDKIR